MVKYYETVTLGIICETRETFCDTVDWMSIHLRNVTESRLQVEAAAFDSRLEKTTWQQGWLRGETGHIWFNRKHYIIWRSPEK